MAHKAGGREWWTYKKGSGGNLDGAVVPNGPFRNPPAWRAGLKFTGALMGSMVGRMDMSSGREMMITRACLTRRLGGRLERGVDNPAVSRTAPRTACSKY